MRPGISKIYNIKSIEFVGELAVWKLLIVKKKNKKIRSHEKQQFNTIAPPLT